MCNQQRLKSAYTSEPRYDKTNKVTVHPADSDQPGHPPSLISVFAVRPSFLLVDNEDLDAQADLSLRWAHSHFVGFVMSWLICAG